MGLSAEETEALQQIKKNKKQRRLGLTRLFVSVGSVKAVAFNVRVIGGMQSE